MSAAQEDRELDSLRRDLGTALDTAKWQVCLEVFLREWNICRVFVSVLNLEGYDQD